MSQIPSDTSHNNTIDQPSGVAQNEDAESGQVSPPASPTRTQSPPTASQGSLPHTSPAQQYTPSSSPSDPPGPPDPDQLLTLPISPHSVHKPSCARGGPDQSQLAPGAATGSSLDPQLALSPTRVARRSDPPLHSPVAPAAPTRRMTRSMKFQLSPDLRPDLPDLRPDLPDLHPDQEPNLSPVLSSAAEMDLDEPAFFTINDDIPIPKSYKAAMAGEHKEFWAAACQAEIDSL
eukprot:gene22536-29663_t